jgi:hypothetical protein
MKLKELTSISLQLVSLAWLSIWLCLSAGETSAMDRFPEEVGGNDPSITRSPARTNSLSDSLFNLDSGENIRRLSMASDSSLVLKGSEKGTVFGSFLVEGEDMTKMQLSMPQVELALGLRSPRLLKWDNGWETIDMLMPLVRSTSLTRSRYVACPWMKNFKKGRVVVISHSADNVDRWSMVISNSCGDTVRILGSEGCLPEEIVWDGLDDGGMPAQPGLLYSYVIEVEDSRGNIRHIPGRGFELPPYVVNGKDKLVLLFCRDHFRREGDFSCPLLVEVASRLNQIESVSNPVTVEVKARNREAAKELCEGVTGALEALVINGNNRVSSRLEVSDKAPPHGAVIISGTY